MNLSEHEITAIPILKKGSSTNRTTYIDGKKHPVTIDPIDPEKSEYIIW